MVFKAICLALTLSFFLGASAPALAAEPQTGTKADSYWKTTVDDLDLLTLSVMPTVERELRIDTDNIWPETDAIKEEFIVPLGTVISYQASPSPSDMAGLTIQRLYHRESPQDDLDFYVNYTSNDTDALIFVDVFQYSLAEEAAEWPPSDEEKSVSFTFTEAGMYGVNAVYMDANEEAFPASVYLVIKVVEGEIVTDEKPGKTEIPDAKPSDDPALAAPDIVTNTITFTIGSSVVSRGGVLLPEPPLVPQVINGYTMLPFRYLVETVLGGSVDYTTPTRTITAKIEGHVIVFSVDSVQISIDGKIHEFGQSPVVIDGATLVPLKVLETFLGEIIEANTAS